MCSIAAAMFKAFLSGIVSQVSPVNPFKKEMTVAFLGPIYSEII